MLLRIEDHDRQRSRRSYEHAILEDLAWLGFRADTAAVRQSERDDIYVQALDRLRAHGLVYACSCSRSEIAAGLKASATRYPGTCRARHLAEAPHTNLRVRLDPSVIQFDDLRHGAQEQRPSEQCGDMVIRDREGNWTYQFAVTVDDMEQGVTLVIRGDDLLDSTGRQLQLTRLLGRSAPLRFLHHPLIMKTTTQKLSKSDRDTGIRDLRASGWSAARVIGQAAFMAGLLPESRDVPADAVSSIIPYGDEVDL